MPPTPAKTEAKQVQTVHMAQHQACDGIITTIIIIIHLIIIVIIAIIIAIIIVIIAMCIIIIVMIIMIIIVIYMRSLLGWLGTRLVQFT